jgi:beta-glucosidase
VEGDNRGSALWEWERRQGWERSGDACRSWDLFEEDLRCLKALNLNAYRFSLEWARVEPRPGEFDQEALARYGSWARRLKEEGIRPIVCFHHFSEPAWLLERHPQGWLAKGPEERLAAFVAAAAPALADSVSDWLIFNEPTVFCAGAYGAGMFPPGRRMFLGRAAKLRQVNARMAEAHLRCAAVLKTLQLGARVGVAQNVSDLLPARPGDEAALERWDDFMHLQFLDAVKGSLDFLGVNYYTRAYVSRLAVGPFGALPGHAEIERMVGPAVFKLLGGRRDAGPRTAMGWEVVPDGLERVLLRLWNRYKLPLMITENGLAPSDGLDRTEFLRGHLAAVHRAIAAGARVDGYLHWSLLDNYEWGSYRPRFGLFDRQRRPAPGSEFYAAAARDNGF